MYDGFVKVAAMTPKVKVADPYYNAEQICALMDEADAKGAKITVFPELCITGYTCQDLFYQEKLLASSREALMTIIEHSDGMDGLFFVGLPFEHEHKLYNVAAVINCGELMGLVPKTELPTYGEFYEGRHFYPGNKLPVMTEFDGQEIPLGTDILFTSDAVEGLTIAVEICEDLWASNPPSARHAVSGASVIVNLSASNETIGKADYRRMLVSAQSGRLACAYIYASAGYGESTQDLVFGGHNIIAEGGKILAQSKRFTNEAVYSDIDIQRIRYERRRLSSFHPDQTPEYMIVQTGLVLQETLLDRRFSRKPFVPSDTSKRDARCEEILTIQAQGLAKRMEHTGCRKAVVGLSGGLDSTLAFLVIAKAYDFLGLPRDEMIPVTMPGFGTTNRTKSNAEKLAEQLGCSLLTIPIGDSVKQHFLDIGLPEDDRSVTYENGQARERTQILMDIANKVGGMVVGTGDLSELALGWATYNGDHMSMYGVNGGIPKTLVRHLVRYYADTCGSDTLQKVLMDILDTPVSPELLPPSDGNISQKTESIVGPYELHDFFLYYLLRWGFSPRKIFRMAAAAFCGETESEYDEEIIFHWLMVFTRRFFAQQFKRSCLPDGPKVGSVAVSPRGDLRMPSDASWGAWKAEMEDLAEELEIGE